MLFEKDRVFTKDGLSLLIRVAEERIRVLTEKLALVVYNKLILEILDHAVKLLLV